MWGWRGANRTSWKSATNGAKYAKQQRSHAVLWWLHVELQARAGVVATHNEWHGGCGRRRQPTAATEPARATAACPRCATAISTRLTGKNANPPCRTDPMHPTRASTRWVRRRPDRAPEEMRRRVAPATDGEYVAAPRVGDLRPSLRRRHREWKRGSATTSRTTALPVADPQCKLAPLWPKAIPTARGVRQPAARRRRWYCTSSCKKIIYVHISVCGVRRTTDGWFGFCHNEGRHVTAIISAAAYLHEVPFAVLRTPTRSPLGVHHDGTVQATGS